MTITVKQLTDAATDSEDDVGLEVYNTFNGYSIPYSSITWTKGRKSFDDASHFGIIQVTGGAAGIRKKGGGDSLITGISDGDYVAYDAFVTWHIPQADLEGLDVVIDGQQPGSIDIDPPID